MVDYTALVSAWSTFTGSSLTTQQRIDNFNARTVAGLTLPMVIPTYKIYNVIASSEFLALDSTARQNVRDILGMGTVDVSNGTNARTRLSGAFATSTATLAALIALATAFDTPKVGFVTASTTLGGLGLPAAINGNDLAAAGGLS